jgi:hypothetical protein
MGGWPIRQRGTKRKVKRAVWRALAASEIAANPLPARVTEDRKFDGEAPELVK